MAIKISLDGLDVSGDARLMNNATIKGESVEVELKNATLSNNASVMDEIQIDQSQDEQKSYPGTNRAGDSESARTGIGSKVKKSAASIFENVLANVISKRFEKK